MKQKLENLNGRQLLLERIKYNEGKSKFSNEEINKEALKRMEKLADNKERKAFFEAIKLKDKIF